MFGLKKQPVSRGAPARACAGTGYAAHGAQQRCSSSRRAPATAPYPAAPPNSRACGAAARLGDAEVTIRLRRRDPPPRGALEQARPEQVRLVHVLEGVLLLAQGSGKGLEAHGAPVELLDDREQQPPVHLVEPLLVDLKAFHR